MQDEQLQDENVEQEDNAQVDEQSEEELPEDEMGYMDQAQDAVTPNSQANSADTLKMVHLFDISQELFEYAKVFEENIENIDRNFIEPEIIVKLSHLADTLERYKSKLRDFIAEVFYKETYEKNLYTYLSLRYELLAMIKYLRSLLDLDHLPTDEEVDEKDSKQLKKLKQK